MLFGRFQIRCVGFLVGKSKNTIEAKEYKSLDEIRGLFAAEVRKAGHDPHVGWLQLVV